MLQNGALKVFKLLDLGMPDFESLVDDIYEAAGGALVARRADAYGSAPRLGDRKRGRESLLDVEVGRVERHRVGGRL